MSKSQSITSKIAEFIRRYVALDADQLEIVATWVAHTWQFSESCPTPPTTPYLYVNSAQKGSGKTLLGIDIMGVLARNPIGVVGMTEATLFHMMDTTPTLLVDEVDMLFSSGRHAGMVGILNNGYRKGGKVPRMKGGEVHFYDAHGPKSLVGIDNGMMPDPTRERCIPINMRRATDEERATLRPFYHYEIEDEVEVLCEELHQWATDNGVRVRDYQPKEIPGLSPRQWEICRPLLQVAHTTGNEKAVRDALTNIFATQVEPENGPEITVLLTLSEMFDDADGKVSTADLLARLQAEDDRFTRVKVGQVSRMLAPFGIKVQAVRIANQVTRGIKEIDCQDAFQRYL